MPWPKPIEPANQLALWFQAKYFNRQRSDQHVISFRRSPYWNSTGFLEYVLMRFDATGLPHMEDRVLHRWRWPLYGVHSIMMEKSAQPGMGGGMQALPLSLYQPSRAKLWYTLQLRGQIHPPYFYSAPICTLWETALPVTITAICCQLSDGIVNICVKFIFDDRYT